MPFFQFSSFSFLAFFSFIFTDVFSFNTRLLSYSVRFIYSSDITPFSATDRGWEPGLGLAIGLAEGLFRAVPGNFIILITILVMIRSQKGARQ